MATHTETRYHVHGQAEPDDTGKLGAMKVARPVWRGPIEKKELQSHLVGWLPYGSDGPDPLVAGRDGESDPR